MKIPSPATGSARPIVEHRQRNLRPIHHAVGERDRGHRTGLCRHTGRHHQGLIVLRNQRQVLHLGDQRSLVALTAVGLTRCRCDKWAYRIQVIRIPQPVRHIRGLRRILRRISVGDGPVRPHQRQVFTGGRELEIRVQRRRRHSTVFARRKYDQIVAGLQRNRRELPFGKIARVVRQAPVGQRHRLVARIEQFNPIRRVSVFVLQTLIVRGEKLIDHCAAGQQMARFQRFVDHPSAESCRAHYVVPTYEKPFQNRYSGGRGSCRARDCRVLGSAGASPSRF